MQSTRGERTHRWTAASVVITDAESKEKSTSSTALRSPWYFITCIAHSSRLSSRGTQTLSCFSRPTRNSWASSRRGDGPRSRSSAASRLFCSHTIDLKYSSTIAISAGKESNVICLSLPVPHTAHVAQWSKHPGATCSRAWHTQWPMFAPQPGHVHLSNNYFW